MDPSTPLLPLHLSLAGRRVAVIGGGPVAWRKVRSAVEAGAVVTVVAPWACDELTAAAAAGEVAWACREYADGDLAGAWLVFAATGDVATDDAVEVAADGARIFCVRASSGAGARNATRSPAVLRRDAVTVSVSSVDGADPRRAVAVRDAIGLALDSGRLPLRRVRGGAGRVTLVGGGPGSVDLLTLAGRRALAEADVVVVDRLGPREVLGELGADVVILEVGKAPGKHPVPQHAINDLLVEHARAGRHVVRLKGGDPFVFGRGGEEVEACRAAGLDVTVVPGVSSAFAVPAAAGIPVTHRGLARQVTVLAGHDAHGVVAADWPALATAAADGNTLVVLMGVKHLPSISASLLGSGAPPDVPVAVIENGCTPAQRLTVGTLADIASVAVSRGVQSPAVVVVGRVVDARLVDERMPIG
ncbi:uroporphyrinogen-III C-methyltransferase [Nakamurella deserti]|uniref:uroporphyrinogen-III C-methyltransferase n=1 Tax=Nakamurella deserti TaxID=2164074 RepID=UPI00197B1092|nr:uroporphyrinogen-III C-methyltransferase [Nakamurella deserti]